jgi:hypothetical protein
LRKLSHVFAGNETTQAAKGARRGAEAEWSARNPQAPEGVQGPATETGENVMSYFRLCAVAGVTALVSATASAHSPWPASIVGTWTGNANTSGVTLTITSQIAGSACQTIIGTFGNTGSSSKDNINGYYCPGSGTVEFMRLAPGSVAPYQVYSGSMASANPVTNRMAGTFSEYAALGNLGQYPFQVSK